MKPSGIEWIGDIPDDWETKRGKFIFTQRITKGNSKNLELLTPSQKYGVIPQIKYEELTGMSPVKLNSDTNFNALKTICNGDFCISLRSFQGGFEYSYYEGVVSPAYQVFYATIPIIEGFYRYLFKDKCFIDRMNSYALSLRDGKPISFGDFANTKLPVPPLETQQKIADYLDEKCGEIDKTIEKQKESIEKLKAYKQSLISETVTKGLNKSTPLKPTGIDFLGDIPSHWEVKRVKYVANSFEKGNGITKDDVIFDGDIQCIRYGEIYSKYDRQCIGSVSNTNIDKIKSPVHISKGDILFAGTGELIEEIGKNIVYMGNKPCLAGGDIIILKHNQNPIFLNYALNSTSSQSQKSYGKLKLKVVHISVSAIGNIRIALPPITEQNQIAVYLDEKCAEIDSTINKKQKIIKKLDAYKKSLIFECVTGKRKIA